MTHDERRRQLQVRYSDEFALPEQRVLIDVGGGWFRILALMRLRLKEILRDESGFPLRISQIKEEGGYLKVSYILHGRTEDVRREVREAIELAVLASHRCCERCAQVGQLIQKPPWRVRCSECEDLPSRSET